VDGLRYHEGLNAVSVTGGVATNVVPDACEVQENYRFAPDLSPQEAIAHGRVGTRPSRRRSPLLSAGCPGRSSAGPTWPASPSSACRPSTTAPGSRRSPTPRASTSSSPPSAPASHACSPGSAPEALCVLAHLATVKVIPVAGVAAPKTCARCRCRIPVRDAMPATGTGSGSTSTGNGRALPPVGRGSGPSLVRGYRASSPSVRVVTCELPFPLMNLIVSFWPGCSAAR
jgi:hypothetical protein